MSTPFPRQITTKLAIVAAVVRRTYRGDLDELFTHLSENRRTGVVMIHVNQGTVVKTEFESRVKETKKVYG